MEKIRRKKYIVNPAFQVRYIGIILLTVFVVALVCILTTFHSSVTLLGEKLGNVYPQGRLVTTLQQVSLIIVLRVIFVIPFVVLAGVILSHKIAGPAYRIERTLRQIGKGNFNARMNLRKYDELQGIAEAINEMAADLKIMFKK